MTHDLYQCRYHESQAEVNKVNKKIIFEKKLGIFKTFTVRVTSYEHYLTEHAVYFKLVYRVHPLAYMPIIAVILKSGK